MNCQKIRELLLTDYLDGESPASIRSRVEEHLKTCAHCRQFEQALRQEISRPLRDIPQANPPDTVWQNIKENIARDKAQALAPSFLRRLLDSLADSFRLHRQAYAVSTVLALSLAVVIFLNSPMRRQMVAGDYLRQQATFIASLSQPVNGEMEQYFSFGSAAEELLF